MGPYIHGNGHVIVNFWPFGGIKNAEKDKQD